MSISLLGLDVLGGHGISIEYSYLGAAVGILVSVASSLRWLRVAQREHYIPGYTSRFAVRWFSDWQRPINPVFALASLLATLLAVAKPSDLSYSGVGLIVVVICQLVAPYGLRYKGSTSPLRFTRRLAILAAVSWFLDAVFLAIGALLGWGITFAAIAIYLVPPTIDLALLLTIPIERRNLAKFVSSAERKLAKVSPRVVAITGSFGKTSTKTYLAHILSSTYSTLASPASFNNRAGLARTINELLTPGTEVFIAEMGTFGKGEIKDLCRWIPPEISAITAIGPVHLERFGSEDAILEAKSEITEKAEIIALNVDDFRLSDFSHRMEQQGKKVWRVSGQDIQEDVAVKDDDEGNLIVYFNQRRLGSMPDIDISRTNLGIAVAIALELGVPESTIGELLPTTPVAKNRLNIVSTESGLVVLDDTYNSNPSGARLALKALERRKSPQSRSVLVTPGMIEMGPRQFVENSQFAKTAAMVVTDFIIVGYTNRKALLHGLSKAKEEGYEVNLVLVDSRPQAVDWVRSNLVSGDSVLYENDLPDHFL